MQHGPILLVPSYVDFPAVVADAIEELQPLQVISLGGAAAMCDDVLDAGGERVPNLVTYLSQEAHVADTRNWSTGSRRVDTRKYARSVVQSSSRDRTESRRYDAQRTYDGLRATVGVADDSDPDAAVEFAIIADGEQVASQQVGFGDSTELIGDVEGALRVRIEVTPPA